MQNSSRKIPAVLMRGGTSKGLFFHAKDLPPAGLERDQLLLTIMGSPDPTGMQLNGLGGGISSTSKIAIISPSKQAGLDVDYLFGQVSLTEPVIDWQGSCGNLAAAVGLYALHQNLVQTQADGSAVVKVWQVNQQHEMLIHLLSPQDPTNWVSIPGVPGCSPGIKVEFKEPGHAGELLPANKPIHTLRLPDGKTFEATLICGANPSIFIHAQALGLIGTELPEQIDYHKLQPTLTAICRAGASLMNIPFTAAVRVAWLSPPSSQEDCDIVSRIMTEGRIHHAHTGTGAINLACAAKIPGTIPYQIVNLQNKKLEILRIAHPQGIMPVTANVVWQQDLKRWCALSAGFIRTAKILMQGDVCL